MPPPTSRSCPALDYLKEKGVTSLFLVGSDYVFPQTANKEIKAYAAANGIEIKGEEYAPLGPTPTSPRSSHKVKDAGAGAVFNTLNGDSNVSFFKEYKNIGLTAEAMPVVSVSIAEEEVAGIGVENLVGQLTAWNYYQTIDSPANTTFVADFKAKYGEDRVTSDPMEAAYTSLYLWKDIVEKAKSFAVADIQAAADGVTFDAPEGTVTVNGENHHIAKTALIGKIAEDGLHLHRVELRSPIEPDPYLTTYPWAAGLTLSRRVRCRCRMRRADPTRRHSARAPRSVDRIRRDSGMDVFVSQLFNGLSVGSILLLAALGLALTFGQMGVINMAHGEFIMAGGYTAFVVQSIVRRRRDRAAASRSRSRSWWAALLGVVLEMTLLRRMYHRPLDTLLVTWGVSLILQQLAKDIFGAQGKSTCRCPTWLSGPVRSSASTVAKTRVFVLVLAVARRRRRCRSC